MPDYCTMTALTHIFTRMFGTLKNVDEHPTQADFDIDPVTGFVPPEPLPRLQGQYKLWEDTLAEASEVLRLGDDVSEEALALKTEGESWRSRVKSVSQSMATSSIA